MNVPQVLILLTALALLLRAALLEPVLPDADDCRARGQAEDCWKNWQTSPVSKLKVLYDEEGRRVP